MKTETNPQHNVPAELKGRDQWVLWRREGKDRSRKVPKQANGYNASSSNPATWGSFAAVLAAGKANPKAYSGLGYVFAADDPYVGIDLDDCRDPATGAIEPWAVTIIDKLDTYAEVSPSKTGVKLWAKGSLPGDGSGRKAPWHAGAVEMYQHSRYFAVTGHAHNAKPIRDCPADVLDLWHEVFGAGAVTSRADDNLAPDPECRLTPPDVAALISRVLELPKAVSDAGGSDATIHAACEIRRHGGYGDVGREILDLYSQNRCEPSWSDAELDHKWEAARKFQPPPGAIFGEITAADLPEGATLETFGDVAPEGPAWRLAFPTLTCAELDAGKYEYEQLITGILVAKQNCMLAGPSKSYKTMIAADAAIALATGAKFLDYFEIPKTRIVGVMSAEIGEGGLQDYARRIAKARGPKLGDIKNLYWCTAVPQFGDVRSLKHFRDWLIGYRIEVLFIDPVYLAMPGADAANMMIVGALLANIGRICHELGVTPILLHHVTKTATRATEALTITDMAYAGFEQWVRQWWTIKPASPWRNGQVTLRLNVGGSTGVRGDVAVSVDEGQPDGEIIVDRKWETIVTPWDTAKAAADQQKAEAKATAARVDFEADLDRVRSALNDGGTFPAKAKTKIWQDAKVSRDDIDALLKTLIENGEVEEEKGYHSGAVRYRLTGEIEIEQKFVQTQSQSISATHKDRDATPNTPVRGVASQSGFDLSTDANPTGRKVKIPRQKGPASFSKNRGVA